MNVYIEYCVDGYHDVKVPVVSLREQLRTIKSETADIFTAPFAVDVVIDEIGRMSIGLDENTVLCYKSADLETQLTALGDLSAEGNVTFYFGDYSVMSRKYLIPYELALDVLEHWTETGELSGKVMWTDKLY
ncbi:MAG: hypothetical protein K2J80_11750 [Oscillospiraceae bacterium]|nr:hypothetical protein [Oscillospiraceae bacterium]